MNCRIVITVGIILMLFLFGCNRPITGDSIKVETITFANETFPYQIAKLTEVDINSVERFEDYKTFADRMNTLIEILNRQIEYDIPLFPTTRDVWSQVSRTITKYGPLINNYNEVINSAKKYTSSEKPEDKKEFYIATGRFGFEASLIIWAVFYSTAYNSVGVVYRSINLNQMAFKHPILVKTILSTWHWTLRNTLIEVASQTATNIFNSNFNWY